MTGLDQVEQVFAQEKHDGANQAKADNAANQAEYFGVVADFAQYKARARAVDHGQQVGKRDPEINQEAENKKWQGAHHQAAHFANLEVSHMLFPVVGSNEAYSGFTNETRSKNLTFVRTLHGFV